MVFTFAVICRDGIYVRDQGVRVYGGEAPTAPGSATSYLDGLKKADEIWAYTRVMDANGAPATVEGAAVYKLAIKYGTAVRFLGVCEEF